MPDFISWALSKFNYHLTKFLSKLTMKLQLSL